MQKQLNDGRRELCIYSRVSSQVAEYAMIDPQYICSGLLKIYLGSQEAACFYVNEEAGLFGILLFFPMCLLTMLSKQENRNTTSTSPPPLAAGSLWWLGTAVTPALSSDPAPEPCVEIREAPVTAQLNPGAALHLAGTLWGKFPSLQAPFPVILPHLWVTRQSSVRMTLLRPEKQQYGGDLMYSSCRDRSGLSRKLRTGP